MAPGSNIPPVNPAPTKPAQGSGQVLQIVSLPDALKDNARSIRLEGEVVGQNRDGTTRIKTSEGNIDVTFRGKQPQPGTKVEVDIPAGNPPRNVTVRPAPPTPQPLPAQTPRPLPTTQAPPTSNSPAPATPAPTPSTPQQPTQPIDQQAAPLTPTTRPVPAQALPPLTTGEVVQLVPLQESIAAPKPAVIPNMPVQDNAIKPAASTGTQIETAITQKPQSGIVTALLQVVKSTLPNLLTQPLPSTAPQAQPAVTIAANLNPVPTTTANILTPVATPDLLQASPLTAKIMAITSPTGQTMYATPENVTVPTGNHTMHTSPQSQATPSVQPVTVTVAALTPQNQPIIPLPLNINGAVQNFFIQTPPGTLPIGAQVTLMPMATAPSIGATAAIPSVIPSAWRGFLPFMQSASVWPAMDDIFQTFYQATPQAAQILGRVIPSPGNTANFGPAVMLFAAAARAGELQAWIGDKKLEMVHKLGKDALVSRLSAETSSLARDADVPSTEWKSIPIPLLWQSEISKVLFHVRREPNESGQEQKDGSTRFILDLSLPRMGDVQLDGMVNGQRLDVIIRTQMPVSYPMQEAMKVAYAGALEGSDVYGELSFQGDLKQWMHVIKGSENFAASI